MITWWRGSRSATTPPRSRQPIMGISSAVATYPTSAGDPPLRRTANGIATAAAWDPATEMTLQAASSRKFRLRSGPRSGNGGAGAAARDRARRAPRGWLPAVGWVHRGLLSRTVQNLRPVRYLRSVQNVHSLMP